MSELNRLDNIEICLNVKKPFAQNKRDIWKLCNYNGTWTYDQLHGQQTLKDLTKLSFINLSNSVWLNGWVFICELNVCGFKSSCSHLYLTFSKLQWQRTVNPIFDKNARRGRLPVIASLFQKILYKVEQAFTKLQVKWLTDYTLRTGFLQLLTFANLKRCFVSWIFFFHEWRIFRNLASLFSRVSINLQSQEPIT